LAALPDAAHIWLEVTMFRLRLRFPIRPSEEDQPTADLAYAKFGELEKRRQDLVEFDQLVKQAVAGHPRAVQRS
jgi:hypothetical protein